MAFPAFDPVAVQELFYRVIPGDTAFCDLTAKAECFLAQLHFLCRRSRYGIVHGSYCAFGHKEPTFPVGFVLVSNAVYQDFFEKTTHRE